MCVCETRWVRYWLGEFYMRVSINLRAVQSFNFSWCWMCGATVVHGLGYYSFCVVRCWGTIGVGLWRKGFIKCISLSCYCFGKFENLISINATRKPAKQVWVPKTSSIFVGALFRCPTSPQRHFLKRHPIRQLHSRIRTHSTLIMYVLRRLSHHFPAQQPHFTTPSSSSRCVRFINALQEPEMFNACILMTRRDDVNICRLYRRLRNLAVHYAKPAFVQIGNYSWNGSWWKFTFSL